MKLTKKQKKELEVWEYFIPSGLKHKDKTDKDIEMFFDWSERGKHKELADKYGADSYFNALVWGKRWAYRHIHEIWNLPSYEEFLANPNMEPPIGYFELFGGLDDEIIPRPVVDFIKKETHGGDDAELIESAYQEVLKEKLV